MNLGVISGLILDRLAGLLLVWLQSKYLNFIVVSDIGVKLIYLPLYLLDLNLIEEFFVELKMFIK